MSAELEKALQSINNRFGKGSTIMGNEVIPYKRFSTGSLGMDIGTGGGWPKGRMVELYGPESAGKTTICIHAMVEAQKAEPNKKVAFIDAEHAFDSTYAEGLGLNLDNLIISQPSNGEEGLEILDTLVSSGAISMAIVDSIAALVPKTEIEGEMSDNQMGLHARLMGKALRKITHAVDKTDTCVIFTNQTREKIGVMFGNPTTTPGGNAMKFYAAIRGELSKSQGDKSSDGEILNSKVKVKFIKNKTAPPFRQCTFDILFGEGIDKASEVLLIAEDAGIIKKSGSWYSYEGTKLGQGAVAVKQTLRDNTDLMQDLESQIKELYQING